MLRLAVPLVAVAALTVVFQAWHPDLTPSHQLAEPTFTSPGRLLGGHSAPGQSTFGMLVSGRNEAWSATIDLIEERPVVGYGFGTGDRLLDPSEFKHFAGISPHNAYLQAVLELGLLGALLLLAPLGSRPRTDAARDSQPARSHPRWLRSGPFSSAGSATASSRTSSSRPDRRSRR